MPYKHKLDGDLRLSDALHLRSVAELRPLLKLLPEAPRRSPSQKAAIVGIIENGLAGQALDRFLTLMTDDQREILGAIVHGRGRALDFRRLKARFGARARAALWDDKNRSIFGLWAILTAPMEADEFASAVPEDLADRLRRRFPDPGMSDMRAFRTAPEGDGRKPDRVTGGETGAAEVPWRQCDREIDAQLELPAVLKAIEERRFALNESSGQPEASSVRRLAGVLSGGDFYTPAAGVAGNSNVGSIRAYGWPWLLRAGGLIRKNPGGILGLTMSGREAMSRPIPGTMRALWKGWINTDDFDEIRRCKVDQIRTKGARREITSPAYRRWAIEDTLKRCPVGEWVTVEEFERYMLANGLEFEVTVDLATLGISSFLGRESADFLEMRGWHLLQRPYIRCFLFEYAALGLIDVCYGAPDRVWRDFAGADDIASSIPGPPGAPDPSLKSLLGALAGWPAPSTRYDGLMCFRLNWLGAYCLGLTMTYEPAAAPSDLRMTVRPNLSIEVEGVPRAGQALLLDRYATRESETLWRLDRGKVVSVVESGAGLERFIPMWNLHIMFFLLKKNISKSIDYT